MMQLIKNYVGTMAWVILLCSLLLTGAPSSNAFEGANGRIVFISNRDGGDYDIYTMLPDGSNIQQLTNDNDFDEERPGFSPDAQKIVYSRKQIENGGNGDIYVMNADGSNQTRLTTANAQENGAQWSADGTKILYKKVVNNQDDIWIMNADGSGQQSFIAHASLPESGPVWAPDNSGVAFSGKRSGDTQPNVFFASVTGQNVTRLTEGDGQNFAAAWSPDSTKIAFRSGRDHPNKAPNIYVMNRDGSNETLLVGHVKEDRGPAWSPDGTKIVFYSNRPNVEGGADVDDDIWVVNSANGGNPVNLTANSSASDINPDWGVATNDLPHPTVTPTPTLTPTPTNTPPPTPTQTPGPTNTPAPGNPADVDNNGTVNLADLQAVIANFNQTQFSIRDPQPDGRITIFDFSLVVRALYAQNPAATPTNGPSPTTGPTPTTGPSPTTPPPSPTPPNVPGEVLLLEWNKPAAQSMGGLLQIKTPHLPAAAQGDWTSPHNYAEGKLYIKAHVKSIPVDQPKMKLGFCFWQGTNQNEPGWGEECAESQLVPGVSGSIVEWSRDMASLNPIKNKPINWILDRWKYGIVVRNKNNKAVTNKGLDEDDPPWNGEDPTHWYPLDIHFTAVVVKKGQAFSGWQHYGW